MDRLHDNWAVLISQAYRYRCHKIAHASEDPAFRIAPEGMQSWDEWIWQVTEEYCDEWEHQDGYTCWATFALEEDDTALENDFKLYVEAAKQCALEATS